MSKQASRSILAAFAAGLALLAAAYRSMDGSILLLECLFLAMALALANGRALLLSLLDGKRWTSLLLLAEMIVLLVGCLCSTALGRRLPSYLSDLFVWFLALPIFWRTLILQRNKGSRGALFCACSLYVLSFLLLSAADPSEPADILIFPPAGMILLTACACMGWFSAKQLRDVLSVLLTAAVFFLLFAFALNLPNRNLSPADAVPDLWFFAALLPGLGAAVCALAAARGSEETKMIPAVGTAVMLLAGESAAILHQLGLLLWLPTGFPCLLGGYGAVSTLFWLLVTFMGDRDREERLLKVSIHPALMKALARRAEDRGLFPEKEKPKGRLQEFLEEYICEDPEEDLFSLPRMSTWSLRLPEQSASLRPYFCCFDEDNYFGVDELMDELRGMDSCTVHCFMGRPEAFRSFRGYIAGFRGRLIFSLEYHPLDREQPEIRRLCSEGLRITQVRDGVFLPRSSEAIAPGCIEVMIAELTASP